MKAILLSTILAMSLDSYAEVLCAKKILPEIKVEEDTSSIKYWNLDLNPVKMHFGKDYCEIYGSDSTDRNINGCFDVKTTEQTKEKDGIKYKEYYLVMKELELERTLHALCYSSSTDATEEHALELLKKSFELETEE